MADGFLSRSTMIKDGLAESRDVVVVGGGGGDGGD